MQTEEMKKYKPGQFVSIGGKLARVCEVNIADHYVCSTCEVCANENRQDYACGIHNSECLKKLNVDYYPKFIKQCGNQDK